MTHGDLFRVFGRIGCLSFGGPAAQIALMHRELVEARSWLTEDQFLRALGFCMLLPGPEAMQLATYAGWRLRGIPGGLIAGTLFVLPGALVIAVLVMLYAAWGTLPLVQAAFLGVKAAVVVIVVQAILRLSRKALTDTAAIALAVFAFLALYVFALPFPLVIGLAALWGALRPAAAADTAPPRVDRAALLRVLLIGGALWAAPILLAWAAGADLLLQMGLFFSKLAVVTFGGAYAVLAYMTQTVVQDQGWLTTAQMIDALGLAETTPGPLILVTQFVGQLTGALQGGPALAAAAALMTLWVTFVPCFIWIFAGAPLIDWLEGQPRLSAALAAVTAAVVGVIANLSLWFAIHVLFAETTVLKTGPVRLTAPVLPSGQPIALALVALAALLLIGRRWPLPAALAATSAAGLAAGALGLA
ncbi:chromate efflux transporter [Histidinibacterium lentulum]|uniref:Chromate efflux transporter n=1 Tax=Histidinibacterium lentulum TaxID=2480588 RepID=A0A3N2RA44_9RHOB|nr:chromate efflux transporter [Histidinibacterium lentulum]ROU04298.1 chromate efflux transporter [Histidinibacterium lentulum]